MKYRGNVIETPNNRGTKAIFLYHISIWITWCLQLCQHCCCYLKETLTHYHLIMGTTLLNDDNIQKITFNRVYKIRQSHLFFSNWNSDRNSTRIHQDFHCCLLLETITVVICQQTRSHQNSS